MLYTSEQFVNANKASIEASLKLVNKSFEGTARVLNRQMDAAKTIAEANAEALKVAFSNGANPEALSSRTAYYERQQQKIMDVSREYFEVIAQTQTDLADLIQGNLDIITSSMKENLEAFNGISSKASETDKAKKRT